MIEEIKKEIELYIIKEHDDRYDEMVDNIFEILDKYNNQQTLVTLKDFENVSNKLIDYQSAFNELFNFYENNLKGMQSKNDVMVLGRLKDLKKKYNLGGE